MLRAHVVVECLQVFEGLDELKVVRGRRLAEQGERLDAGIVQTVGHERIKQRLGLGDELGVDVHVRDHKDFLAKANECKATLSSILGEKQDLLAEKELLRQENEALKIRPLR